MSYGKGSDKQDNLLYGVGEIMRQVDKLKDILEEYNLNREEEGIELFESIKSIIYQTTTEKHDLYYLCKILPEDQVVKLIDFYNGSTIRIPSKKHYRDNLILVIAFYLKEIEGRDWQYIKDTINADTGYVVNGVSLGKRIGKIKDILNKETLQTFEKIDIDQFMSLLEKFQIDVDG